MSQARRIDELVRFSPEKMQKVAVFEPAAMMVDVYCLAPGQAQKVHAHAASDKVYLCLRGRLVAIVGDAQVTLEPGEAVHAPAGVVHGIENREKTEAVAYVVTAPRP